MAKPKPEEHENHERWLVSYADFMTLMFAFFVVLWSQSKVDRVKLAAVIDGLQTEFHGAPLDWVGEATPKQKGEEEDASDPPASPLEEAIKTFVAASDPQINAVRTRLQGTFSNNVIQLGLVDNTLVVVLPEQVMFEPGSAVVHESFRARLAQLAAAVEGEPVILDVVGHADGVPISGPPFEDNWGLASARAISVVRVLSSQGIDKEHVSAVAEVVPPASGIRRSVTLRIRSLAGNSTACALDSALESEEDPAVRKRCIDQAREASKRRFPGGPVPPNGDTQPLP